MNLSFSQKSSESQDLDDNGKLSIGTKRRWPIVLGWVIIGLLAVLAVFAGWYELSGRSVDPDSSQMRTITVTKGMTPVEIGELLHDNGLIRSILAYRLYIKLNDVEDSLQAGTYKIAPSEQLSEVIDHLTAGEKASVAITFYPGSTLYDPTDIEDSKRTDVYTMLRRAGYGDDEVRAALNATYESPLFAGKPPGTSLEGYIYGETYLFSTTATAEEVLEHTFDEYYRVISENDIVSGARKQGLDLYQAITLASIVQREVSGYEDMRKVAQVFLKRLDMGMMLGSDVTFIYAAQQDNRPPTVDYESPYNTRVHTGLPPGPIANPSIDALRAVVDPADTNYLYFVAGEDGNTYFALDQAEHERNVENYCGDLCE